MIRCYRGKDGYPRVDVGEAHPEIGRFLEGDVQSSMGHCKELIEIAEQVELGRCPSYSGTGNAHTVTITPTGVTIENEWDESLGIAKLSIAEFKQCLQLWLECISTPRK